MSLIPLHKAAGEWVVFLEFIVARSLVIAKHTGDREVLRSGIEDHSSWLGNWRSHVDGTEIDGVVPTVERHLELKIIPIVLRGIGNFADKLGHVSVRLAALLTL